MQTSAFSSRVLPPWKLALTLVAMGLLVGCNGCGSSSGRSGSSSNSTGGAAKPARRAFLDMGTAPVGGAFPVVGGAICEVLNAHKGDNRWKLDPKGTKGSQANIRGLANGKLQLALSNSAISYFAVRGESGWEQKYEIRAIATLAPNVAMFITRQETGLRTMSDLKGKRVVLGPSGAGFDMFIEPLVNEHGIDYEDFAKRSNATQSGAVTLLADNNADAAFVGGAVPTAAINQACATHNIFFIPFDEDAKGRLVEKYPFFRPITIPADKYTDLEEDYQGLDVGSMHLITSADQDEDLIYQLTKTIWENREEIAGKHAAGKAINEKNVTRYTGTPFHPGAIRFYKELGIWPEADTSPESE